MSETIHKHWIFSAETAFGAIPRIADSESNASLKADYNEMWDNEKGALRIILGIPNIRIVVLRTEIRTKNASESLGGAYLYYSLWYAGPELRAERSNHGRCHFEYIGNSLGSSRAFLIDNFAMKYAVDEDYVWELGAQKLEMLNHISLDLKRNRKLTIGGHRNSGAGQAIAPTPGAPSEETKGLAVHLRAAQAAIARLEKKVHAPWKSGHLRFFA